MAPSDRGGKQGDGADKPQDPLVQRLRPDPSQPPTPVLVLEGLLGDSDRSGFRRLYFTRALDVYAEFRTDDVVDVEPIGEDHPPFVGEQATRVRLKRDAPVDYTRSRVGEPSDPFDLDVRLGPVGAVPREPPLTDDGCGGATFEAECPGPTRDIDCQTQFTCVTCGFTCNTCNTCVACRTCDTCGRTCITCPTGCAHTCGPACPPTHTPTCVATCAQTCAPTCAATCAQTCANTCAHTCAPTCAATCHTCVTRCPPCQPTEVGPICVTRGTCNPHIPTCGLC